MKKTIILLISIMTGSQLLLAAIINVPADQSTIQAGLNAANEGDTVLVAAGTYYENITWPSINGIKLIGSSQEDCIIDGSQQESVIRFEEDLDGIIDSNTQINSFMITNGSASVGGGIYCWNSSPSLVNVMITSNSASGAGGGIFCRNNSSPCLANMTLTNNNAHSGGGIYCYNNSSPNLDKVTITNNSASHGGGIYCRNNSNPCLANMTITNNSASEVGGGIYCYSNSSPTLAKVTLTHNSADSHGGGIYCISNSNTSLVNSILWDNLPQAIYFYEDYEPNSIIIAYSDIQGGEAGIITNDNGEVYWETGNIDSNPLFTDAENGDYTLQAGSPCIDTGTAYFDWEGEVLVDMSEDEYVGSAPDMGAFEYSNIGVIDEDLNDIPAIYTLFQNYPNPFNPSTTIEFSIKNDSNVAISVYNIKGQKIKTLANNEFIKGTHSVIWNGDDTAGKSVSSGIYFYKLNVDGKTEVVKKCLLLK